MLRIAIIGCGKIADQHVHAVARIPDCEIVAVCDREELMAQQLAMRYRIAGCFSDLTLMLREVKPDVVHITTPPQSHFALAKQCLDAGSHVYLEKPFTITAPEADELIRHAQARGRILTAGHNYQFTPEMVGLRALVAGGFLGGAPVYLESHWSYELGDAGYVGPMLGSRTHWVRQLPGQLLHNLISHGVAKLAEYLNDDLKEIVATAHQSPRLKALGGQEVQDELRVLIRDSAGVTAYFCFSTRLKPTVNRLLVVGPSGSLIADILTGSLIRLPGRSCKSYLTFFLPPFLLAREHFLNSLRNISAFLRRRLYQDFGMKELIERFYTAVRSNGAPPIPYREILLTARIMDEIFAQIRKPQA